MMDSGASDLELSGKRQCSSCTTFFLLQTRTPRVCGVEGILCVLWYGSCRALDCVQWTPGQWERYQRFLVQRLETARAQHAVVGLRTEEGSS